MLDGFHTLIDDQKEKELKKYTVSSQIVPLS